MITVERKERAATTVLVDVASLSPVPNPRRNTSLSSPEGFIGNLAAKDVSRRPNQGEQDNCLVPRKL